MQDNDTTQWTIHDYIGSSAISKWANKMEKQLSLLSMIANLDITDWVIRYSMDPCSTILDCMYKRILDMVLLCTFIAMDTFSHISMQSVVENTETIC